MSLRRYARISFIVFSGDPGSGPLVQISGADNHEQLVKVDFFTHYYRKQKIFSPELKIVPKEAITTMAQQAIDVKISNGKTMYDKTI